MSNLYETIFKPVENLSHRTKHTYISKMMSLNPNPKSLTFLYDTNAILKQFADGSDHTKKSYLSAICSTIKYSPKKRTKKLEKAYNLYQTELAYVNNKISTTTNTLSAKDKDNWVTREEITAKLRNYKRRFNRIVKKDANDISDDEFMVILEYVILALYTLQAPRREKDFMLMFINSDDLNSVDMEKQQFIYREFKDKRALGTQVIDIPDDLFKIIKIYVRILKNRFKSNSNESLNDDTPIKFLVKPSGRFVLRGDIRTILSAIFGKPVGPNSLRRTYATETYKPILDKMKTDAKNMGTSTAQIKQSYIKNNSPSSAD